MFSRDSSLLVPADASVVAQREAGQAEVLELARDH
jgi:hypothetical protein